MGAEGVGRGIKEQKHEHGLYVLKSNGCQARTWILDTFEDNSISLIGIIEVEKVGWQSFVFGLLFGT